MAPGVPEPILLHLLKHHLGYIQAYVRLALARPLPELALELRTIGSSQLDLYLGPLQPAQLAQEVLEQLQTQRVLSRGAYLTYLGTSGYRSLTLSDGSIWTLRWGLQPHRHVHLHPSRYALHTLRIKANHLKTAIVVHIAANQQNAAISLALVNQVRAQWLQLPPVIGYTSSEGLGKVLTLL